MFNKKICIAASATALAFILTGCTINWRCHIVGDISGKPTAGCEVFGTFEIMANKLIRPINTMLAETTGFTFSEWDTTNFNDFSLKLEGAGSSIKSNAVIVKVYNGNSEIGSQSFSVYVASNGDYKFTSPNSVRDWAVNFIDIGTRVAVDFEIEHQAAGNIQVQAKQQNALKAAATAYFSSPIRDTPPISEQ